MVIKNADDRSEDIAALTVLLTEPGLTNRQKSAIEQEIRNMAKGAWGEQQAAYYLNFHFDGSKNSILLHDLRFVFSDGKTAQIDHLLINRFLDIYVLESKNWNSLTVDETGGCNVWEGRRPIGVASPLEQVRRHTKVLERAFQIDEQLRTLAPRQEFKPRVLLATECHLKAPHHREWYIKADAFHSTWKKEIDNEPILKTVLSARRFVSRETLMKIGTILMEIHNPGRRDWRARFGLGPLAPEAPKSGNMFVDSIPGLSKNVPQCGTDWFEFTRVPTADEKKQFKAAGYRGKPEKGSWFWRQSP